MSVAHLQEELTTVELLLRLLQQEYAVLKARDLPALEQVVTEKQRCIEQLRELIARRLDDLQRHGLTADLQGITTWLNQLPAVERVAATRLWAELEQAVPRLHEQNDINGAVIAAGRSHVDRSLAILSGRDSLDFLYDQGTRKVFGSSHRGTIAKA